MDKYPKKPTQYHLENPWQLALEISQIGLWDIDVILGKEYRTLKHDQIFGYSHQLPGWSFEQFLGHLHPDDHTTILELSQNPQTRDTDWCFECRIFKT